MSICQSSTHMLNQRTGTTIFLLVSSIPQKNHANPSPWKSQSTKISAVSKYIFFSSQTWENRANIPMIMIDIKIIDSTNTLGTDTIPSHHRTIVIQWATVKVVITPTILLNLGRQIRSVAINKMWSTQPSMCIKPIITVCQRKEISNCLSRKGAYTWSR